jgi:glycosyltransferase involved in cell wall biosynthesis
VDDLQQRLRAAGVLEDVKFCRNISREEKIAFLKSLDVFSVPALYGEAFGLYVIEALAAGIPVVQPRHAAFVELIESTGGGLIAEANADSLAEKIGELLLDLNRARALGETGSKNVFENFSVEKMARETVKVFSTLLNFNHG